LLLQSYRCHKLRLLLPQLNKFEGLTDFGLDDNCDLNVEDEDGVCSMARNLSFFVFSWLCKKQL
jgi:hypothetical protein